MRLLRICEEKGSGVDKVITSIEEMNLPLQNMRNMKIVLELLYMPIKNMQK